MDYTVTAHDLLDGDLTPSCVPASGAVFPLGVTTVTCTVTDSDTYTTTASFTVTVEDTTAPVIESAAGGALVDIAVTAAGTGAVVSFSAVATDLVDGDVPVTCTPPSGSSFPVGSTTVTCAATDAAGNTGTVSFVVAVAAAGGGSTPTPSVTPTPGGTTEPTTGGAGAAGGELPRTGPSAPGLPITLAGALIGLGMGAVVWARHRRAAR